MRRGILVLLLGLSGCGPTVWYKDSATQQDFNRDTYECQREAYAAGGQAVTLTPTMYTVIGSSRPVPNRSLYNSCMVAHGYYTK